MLPALILALSTSYVAWFFQHHETSAIYPFDGDYTAPEAIPDARLTEVRMATPDGAELILWTSGATRAGAATILYLPGNAGTLADRARRFSDLLDAGFGVAALAYRGSSGSTGTPSEATLTADALMVADRLAAGGGRVVLYGESFGAALAVKLSAAGRGAALVLESPFTSIPDLVAAQYPTEDLATIIRQPWDSRAAIARVRAPLMIVHGRADRLVPQAMGRALFDAAGSTDKTFLDAGPRGHNQMWSDDLRPQVFGFMDGG